MKSKLTAIALLLFSLQLWADPITIEKLSCSDSQQQWAVEVSISHGTPYAIGTIKVKQNGYEKISENLERLIPTHVGAEYSTRAVNFNINQIGDDFSIRTQNGSSKLACETEFLEAESKTCFFKVCTRDGAVSGQKQVPPGYKCPQLSHNCKV